MDRILARIKRLPKETKIRFIIIFVITACLAAALPVYSWFCYQRKAAEMYKVEYPNSLYINAANREDQVNFRLAGINIGELRRDEEGYYLNENNQRVASAELAAAITKKQYVFSVSGSNTKRYILQLAHTNNNLFDYAVYEAEQTSSPPSGNVEYIKYQIDPGAHKENPFAVIGTDVAGTTAAAAVTTSAGQTTSPAVTTTAVKYYTKGSMVMQDKDPATDKNRSTDANEDVHLAKDSDIYFNETYGSSANVEAHAIPTYLQKEIRDFETDESKLFCHYYILEVTWNGDRSSVEEKETDMVYLSVSRTN